MGISMGEAQLPITRFFICENLREWVRPTSPPEPRLQLRSRMHIRSRGVVSPELCEQVSPSGNKRAQGRSGAGLSHGPPAERKAGGSHHRFGRHFRPSLRDGITNYTRSSRGTAVLPPSQPTRHRPLGISTAMPEPRDFLVAPGSFVRASKPTLRPNAPTASRTRRP